MKKYYSGFVTTDYAFHRAPPYFGRGWRVVLSDQPASVTSLGGAIVNGVRYEPQAVIIEAKSLERAQSVVELIYGCLYMLDDSLPYFLDVHEAIPEPLNSSVRIREEDKEEHWRYYNSNYVLPACMLAAKVSQRRAWQYALFKYWISQRSFSTEHMRLDPSHWSPIRFVFDSALVHVRCATAIQAAYSVLEELSLEIRASQSNPSTIDGEWNPSVKADLERRLKKAGVNLNEPAIWIQRDTPTKIERERPPRIVSPAEWQYWKIRDGNVQVVDAILYTSWLRSKISAHKLRELAGSLNYYTVYSVQMLARRIFLEKMGFWR